MATQKNIFSRVQAPDPKFDGVINDIYDKLAHLSTVPASVTPTPTPTPVTPVFTGGSSSSSSSSSTSYAFTDVPLLSAVPSNNPVTGAPYAVDGVLVDVGGVLYRYAGGPTYQWQVVEVAEEAVANAEWLTGVAGTNTITATTVTTYAALAAGFLVRMIPANTNSGATTLAVNGIAAGAVTKNGTTALSGGELLAGKIALLLWDGTRWQIIGVIAPISATLLASDANGVPSVAALATDKIYIGSAGALPVAQTISGDATLAASGALTLATVNGSPGTYGDGTHVSQVTVNAKGLDTTVASVAITGAPGDFAAVGNLEATTVGKGLQIKAGSNARVGTGTLVGGTLLVANTSVTANTLIFLTDQGNGVTANIGALYVSARVNGTSFTVSSTNALDTSDFAYLLIETL